MGLFFISKAFFSKTTKLAPFFPKPTSKTPSKPIYPKQHPVNLNSANNEIISIDNPNLYLSPANEVNHKLYKPKDYDHYISPKHTKSLDLCLVGASNVGKSSLMNKIIGHYISSVSNKANTTDDKILGIYTNIEKSTQLLFYDTPGITKLYKHTDHYVTKAWDIITDCDKVLFVVDSVKRMDNQIKEVLVKLKNLKLNEEVRNKINKLKSFSLDHSTDIKSLTTMVNELEDQGKSNGNTTTNTTTNDASKATTAVNKDNIEIDDRSYRDINVPVYLILNKIDLCYNKRKLKWLVNELEDLYAFEKIFYTSAETGYGIQDLIHTLEEEAIDRPWQYDPKLCTNMSEIERIEELMKAQIFQRFFKELPFKIESKLTEFRKRTDGSIKLGFTFRVSTPDQVRILIGHHARNLNHVKDHFAAELAKIYNTNIIVNIRIIKGKGIIYNQQEMIVDPTLNQKLTEKELEAYKAGKFNEEILMRKRN